MTIGLEDFLFPENFPIFLHNTRNITKGERGNNSAGAESLWGAKKTQQRHKRFFQNSTFVSERP